VRCRGIAPSSGGSDFAARNPPMAAAFAGTFDRPRVCSMSTTWTITSGLNVVSAHVVIARDADSAKVLDRLCECLSGDFDIEHSTFQLEREDRRLLEDRAHA
jgi:hypothetical protein